MRIFTAIVLTLGAGLPPAPAHAQEPGSIEGQVVDAETNAPLSGVTVQLQGFDMGALSGEDGRYRIQGVPAGGYIVLFQRMGYGSVTRPDVIVAPGRATQADADLPEVAVQLDGIVVDAGFYPKADGQPASAVHLNAEEIRRDPGAAGDISRVLLALPSTAQVMDNANDLFVRGGSPLENAFFIDGIQVGNINHFPVKGSTGGPIGMVNLEFVGDVRFSAGGFSPAFGDRLSSIVDIELREGSRERAEVGAELSMVAAEAFGDYASRQGTLGLSWRRLSGSGT